MDTIYNDNPYVGVLMIVCMLIVIVTYYPKLVGIIYKYFESKNQDGF